MSVPLGTMKTSIYAIQYTHCDIRKVFVCKGMWREKKRAGKIVGKKIRNGGWCWEKEEKKKWISSFKYHFIGIVAQAICIFNAAVWKCFQTINLPALSWIFERTKLSCFSTKIRWFVDSYNYTHTDTHTYIERKRERRREAASTFSLKSMFILVLNA